MVVYMLLVGAHSDTPTVKTNMNRVQTNQPWGTGEMVLYRRNDSIERCLAILGSLAQAHGVVQNDEGLVAVVANEETGENVLAVALV